MKAQEFITEGLRDPKDNPCWKGYKPVGTKKKAGKTVPNCVPKEGIEEAKSLNKRVRVVKTGETGTIRQVKHGAFKGAPKSYFVDLDNGKQADNLPASALRLIKDDVAEEYNAEYDDEAGMADNNLETLERAVQGIDELIDAGDNLPEWCQEKIAIAKSMLVNVWDYMRSEEDRGAVAEDWQKANRKDKTPGMSKKAVAAYRRENPGSKLQTAVTTKPSKLKKGSKASKRRKSYCSRSKGQMDMHNIDCSKTPDKAICKARRRWNCE